MLDALYDATEGLPSGVRFSLLFGLPWGVVIAAVYLLVPLPVWIEYRASKLLRRATGYPLPPLVGDIFDGVITLRPAIRRAGALAVSLLLLLSLLSWFSTQPDMPDWLLRIDDLSADAVRALVGVG